MLIEDKSLRDYFLIAFTIPVGAVMFTMTLYGRESGLVITQLSTKIYLE